MDEKVSGNKAIFRKFLSPPFRDETNAWCNAFRKDNTKEIGLKLLGVVGFYNFKPDL